MEALQQLSDSELVEQLLENRENVILYFFYEKYYSIRLFAVIGTGGFLNTMLLIKRQQGRYAQYRQQKCRKKRSARSE